MTKLSIVLTGASGGIGSAIAHALADDGHRLMLIGRNEQKLKFLCNTLKENDRHTILVANLLEPACRDRIVNHCSEHFGRVDVLINNAGVSTFSLLQDTSEEDLASMLNTNLLSPILLTRDLLPLLRASERPSIINIGSTFGTIGYAGFTGYSASKFGLRGFSEALRRELADESLAVHYLAPRAVSTDMNSVEVNALNNALGNAIDPPERVAIACRALINDRDGKNQHLGWPERIFVKVNSLMPRLVDGALRKQLSIIKQHCLPNN